MAAINPKKIKMNVDIYTFDEKELAALNRLLLDGRGRIYPFKAAFYHDYVQPDLLRVWCNKNARYGVVTRELLDWLLEQINHRTALEIGAGMGDLGSHLGIPMTDSYQQVDNPETKITMQACLQTPTRPPSNVLKANAQNAVLQFKPAVVIGSWITQHWLPGDEEGNMHGPREEQILKNCETYIHIGNENVHGNKRILKLPHETYKFPWLISRAKDPTKNVIWVWHNQKSK